MTGLTNPWQPVISIMRFSLFIVLPIRDGMLLSINPDSRLEHQSGLFAEVLTSGYFG